MDDDLYDEYVIVPQISSGVIINSRFGNYIGDDVDSDDEAEVVGVSQEIKHDGEEQDSDDEESMRVDTGKFVFECRLSATGCSR
jgi:hypothetical protein